MEKAYDVSVLAVGLKEDGLDLGEEAAKKAFLRVVKWLKDSAQLSATPFDDVAVAVLSQFEPIVLGEIDKIDGKPGA